MIKIGEFNELTVDSVLDNGLYLACDEDEFVLLPTEEGVEDYIEGDVVRVFVYRGNEDKLTATLKTPKLCLNGFALLQVQAVTSFGAFMDMGLDKDLMVPIKEQKDTMKEGRWYVVYMGLDYQTNRLYGSSKVQKFLQNQLLSVQEKEKVEIIVYKKTDIGFTVIVNDEHWGLVYDNEVFGDLNVGDKLNAYVKKIREDKKLDISLQPIGYESFISEGSEKIYRMLEANKGFLSVTDKSAPALIYDKFGMSKKAFKKALGDLYRQRKVIIEAEGIRLVNE